MANEQTHINVTMETKRKLEILRGVRGVFGYELAETLVDSEWEKAKKQGLVTDAMLQSPTQPKKRIAASREVIAA